MGGLSSDSILVAVALAFVAAALAVIGRALGRLVHSAQTFQVAQGEAMAKQLAQAATHNRALAQQLGEALKLAQTEAAAGKEQRIAVGQVVREHGEALAQALREQVETVANAMADQLEVQSQVAGLCEALVAAQEEQNGLIDRGLDEHSAQLERGQKDTRAAGQSLSRSIGELTDATTAAAAAAAEADDSEALVEALQRLSATAKGQSQQNDVLVAALERLTAATEGTQRLAERSEYQNAELTEAQRSFNESDRQLRQQLTETLARLSDLQAKSSEVQSQLYEAQQENNALQRRDIAERAALPKAKLIVRDWLDSEIPTQSAKAKGSAKPISLMFPDVDELERIAYTRAAELLGEEPQVKKLAVHEDRVTFIWDSSPWAKQAKSTRPAALR